MDNSVIGGMIVVFIVILIAVLSANRQSAQDHKLRENDGQD